MAIENESITSSGAGQSGTESPANSPVSVPALSDKVVFLDIDGPMIPASFILVDRNASWQRRFPSTTVAVVNRLCENTGAKVVFNTTHNRPLDGVANIDAALIQQGLSAGHLHDDRHTKYPDIDRALAVKEWLARHPEVTDWVALDDVRFTDDERLIFVDSDAGLHFGHLREAIDRLGGKPIMILM